MARPTPSAQLAVQEGVLNSLVCFGVGVGLALGLGLCAAPLMKSLGFLVHTGLEALPGPVMVLRKSLQSLYEKVKQSKI